MAKDPTSASTVGRFQDLGKDKYDRVYKSVIYSDSALKEAKTKYDWTQRCRFKNTRNCF